MRVAKGKVVSSSQLGSKLCEEELIAEVVYSNMSFTEVTRHRMRSEIEVQKLEKEVEVERTKLPSMKKEGKEVSG